MSWTTLNSCTRATLRTKPEAQFKHPPLHPLWHKHYSGPHVTWRRILSTRWGLYADGNRDLIKMLDQMVTPTASYDIEKLAGDIAHRMVMDGYEERAKCRLTGDWIIFGKQDGLERRMTAGGLASLLPWGTVLSLCL